MSPDLAGRPVPGTPHTAAAAGALARFVTSAPIVPVRNVTSSTAFYERVLGFDVLRRNDDGSAALVARDDVRIMLLRVAERRALEATREHISAYVWVDDVTALWQELAPRLVQLPAWRVRHPFRQPYGTVEFHVKDPDGFLLFFAEDPFAPAAKDGLAGRDSSGQRPN